VLAFIPTDAQDPPSPTAIALTAPPATGSTATGPDTLAATAARRRAVARQGPHVHAGIFAIVMTVLVIIWAITSAGYFWPIWPLLGWGALLALHTWIVRPWHRPDADPNARTPRTSEASGEARPAPP
jgi:hypothetical protein